MHILIILPGQNYENMHRENPETKTPETVLNDIMKKDPLICSAFNKGVLIRIHSTGFKFDKTRYDTS